MELNDVIAALRDTQMSLSTSDCYSAGAKRLVVLITESLSNCLKENDFDGFWTVYNDYLSDKPDITCEVLEELFARLKIETVDPLSALLK